MLFGCIKRHLTNKLCIVVFNRKLQYMIVSERLSFKGSYFQIEYIRNIQIDLSIELT